MRCPSCGEEIRPEHSICPYCDEVLDESFLDEAGDDLEDEPARATEPELPAFDGPSPTDELPSQAEPTPRPAPPPAAVAPASRRGGAPERADFEELNDAFRAVTDRLHGMTLLEKLGAVAAFVVFAASLLPWIDRGRSDWLIGTDLGGWVTAIGGLACVVLIALLPRSKLAALASAALGALSVLLALAALAERGSAAMGLYLTLLGGAGLAASGVLALLPRRPADRDATRS